MKDYGFPYKLGQVCRIDPEGVLKAEFWGLAGQKEYPLKNKLMSSF